MAHPLPGCAAKVDRAETHFKTLHDEIRQFVSEEEPHAYLPRIDKESSRYVVTVQVKKPTPPSWSLIVGDFVQNLRASLDHLVCQLVLANGHVPSRSTCFPILSQQPTSKNGYLRTWNANLRGVHPAAVKAIRECQPYLGPNGPRRHLLRNLRELSNEDKHRVVLRRFAAVARIKPNLEITPIRDVAPFESYQLWVNRPLKSGDEVLTADIEITGDDPQIHLKGVIPFDVGFGKPLVALEGMHDIFNGVDAIISLFASSCMGGPPVDPRPLGVRLGYEDA